MTDYKEIEDALNKILASKYPEIMKHYRVKLVKKK